MAAIGITATRPSAANQLFHLVENDDDLRSDVVESVFGMLIKCCSSPHVIHVAATLPRLVVAVAVALVVF